MAQKRRKFSAEFKLDTVMEGLRGQKSIAQICRERDITEPLYYQWKQRFEERVLGIFADERQRKATNDHEAQRVAELERMVGRLTMEVEILKKARSWLDTQRARNGQ
jgi:transposase-like protein